MTVQARKIVLMSSSSEIEAPPAIGSEAGQTVWHEWEDAIRPAARDFPY
jgi:hypothetical protein